MEQSKILKLISEFYPKICRFIIERLFFLPYILKLIILTVLPEKIYSVRISHNLKLLVDVREHIGNFIYFNKCYEPIITKWFMRFIKRSSLVIDIGAHIGYYTSIAADIVGSEGRVIAFEPYYKNYYLLRKTILKNNFQNVILETFAVADRGGRRLMYFPYNVNLGTGSFFKHKSLLHTSSYFKKKMLIDTVSLDAYLLEKNIKEVNLLKIDAEGVELSIIKGMCGGLREQIYKAIIIDCVETGVHNKERDYISELKSILRYFQYRLYHFAGKDKLGPEGTDFYRGSFIAFPKNFILDKIYL